MKKLRNEEKYLNYKKRKILRTLIIIFSIVTLILAVLSLLKVIDIVWAIILFVFSHILLKYRETIIVNEKTKEKKC